MVDCQLYDLKPAGHHLTNVLLHVSNTLLLFAVLKRMSGAIWRSAMVAALFAWHPLHVESVAWIAERKDVLSAFFWMLTLWAYVRYAEQSRGFEKRPRSSHALPYYLLAVLFFALGLMSKPMVVTLPFVLLLLDYWPLGRLRSPKISAILKLFLEKLPFFGLAAVACVLTVLAQRQAYSIVSMAALPLRERMFHTIVAYGHYLGATFLPRGLAAFYPYDPPTPLAQVILPAVILAFVTVLVFWFGRRRGYLVTGWLWFLGTLVPVIGLVQVGDQAWADRYTYLPLIGLFISVVWGAADAAAHAGRKAQTALGVVGVAISLTLLPATWVQLHYWKNTRALFEHARNVTQHNARAAAVLGSLLAEEGKLDQAMDLYRLALSYKPGDPEAHFSMGKALDQQGKLEEAVAEYKKVLWFKQLRAPAHVFIGADLAKLKNYPEAAAHYRAALALDPQSATALNNLARILHSQGRLDEAIEDYSRALKIDPELAEARNNLGVLLLQKGRVEEAVPQLRQALRVNPGDPQTQYNLAMALTQLQQWSEASQLFSKLAPANPKDANLYCQFALALRHTGKTREAMSAYAHALLLQPDFPQALEQLAWILSTDSHAEFRNGTQAVAMAERACELTGRKDAEKLKTLAAAYAEAGRFQDAVAAAQNAVDIASHAGQRDLAAKFQRVLESLKEEKPWREEGTFTTESPTAK